MSSLKKLKSSVVSLPEESQKLSVLAYTLQELTHPLQRLWDEIESDDCLVTTFEDPEQHREESFRLPHNNLPDFAVSKGQRQYNGNSPSPEIRNSIPDQYLHSQAHHRMPLHKLQYTSLRPNAISDSLPYSRAQSGFAPEDETEMLRP